jgi:hypothetical protein
MPLEHNEDLPLAPDFLDPELSFRNPFAQEFAFLLRVPKTLPEVACMLLSADQPGRVVHSTKRVQNINNTANRMEQYLFVIVD